jgi:indole-3-glycerol phosphate synthase
MGFLTDVVEDVRRRLDRSPIDEAALMTRCLRLPPPRPFADALAAGPAPVIIAEVKRSSPSAGRIADADAAERARAYRAGGAAAVSVLTEPRHFDGSIADLRAVRLAVDLPVLRKDFLIHPGQVIESRAEGADAVLLIAAVLSEPELKAMLAAAADLGLGALVEVHAPQHLATALATDAAVIGVNARDLETLEVDVARALAMVGEIPSDRVAVLESGVATRGDVERAAAAGARGILVGEALMRAPDPAAAVRTLRGTP